MQYKIFSLPFSGDVDREEEMNLFLRQHRVVNVAREVTSVNGNSFWTFCIEFLEGGKPQTSSNAPSAFKSKSPKINYREVLSEDDFAIYAALRDRRKEVSVQDVVPVYTICTNEQLAFFAQNRPETRDGLLKCPGFGEGKADRYGEAILEIVKKYSKKETTSDKKEG